MSLTASSIRTSWRSTCRVLRVAVAVPVVAVFAACAESLSPGGPRATVVVLPELSAEGVVIDTETPGRVQVTARIRFACVAHPLVPRVQPTGEALTLTVERRFPAPCELGAPPERSYRADITGVPSGAWTLRVVHTYPDPLLPPPPDTVFLGPVVVP